VTTVLMIAILAVLVAVVLLLPFWGRRRRVLTSMLTRYQTIAEALLDGDLARAREALKAIIREDTDDVGAYLRLARVFRKEGELERAVALRRSLIARDLKDKSVRREVLEGLITDLILLRRFMEARAVAETLKSLDRRNPLIARAEFYASLEQEDWGAALKALRPMKRAGADAGEPEPFQLRTYVAERKSAAGQVREARKLLEEALKANPRFAPALLLLGGLWSREGDHEKAAQVWTRLLRERPETAPHVVGKLEKAYFEMGRFGDLARLYEDLVAEEGGTVPVLRLAWARMALRKGDVAEGLRLIEELPEQPSGEARELCWRLYFLLESGQVDAARGLLKDVVETVLNRPPDPPCIHCGRPVEPHLVRCPHCLGWLPDPFVRRGKAPCQR